MDYLFLLRFAQLCGRTIRVDHVENYRLPKNLQQEENQLSTTTGDPTKAGQAYQGQELANKYSLEKGQDLFAPVQTEDSDDNDETENSLSKKEAKRQRKQERQRKRDEKEKRRREKERRRSDKEERKREKRARKLTHRKERDDAGRDSKRRRFDSDSSSSHWSYDCALSACIVPLPVLLKSHGYPGLLSGCFFFLLESFRHFSQSVRRHRRRANCILYWLKRSFTKV